MTEHLRLKTQDSTLLVISHTEHFLDRDGEVYGWTPTIRELDFLANHFKKIIHLAVLHKGNPPASSTTYRAKNIVFHSIPPFGGKGIINKLGLLWAMPLVCFRVIWLLKKSELFQFRAPTSIGLVLIPLLTLFYRKKKGWYKYAGSWVDENMPLSYKIQKWMLERWQKRPVTINGQWPGQPAHVHSFTNPCLYTHELPVFKEMGNTKQWQQPYTACYVGRMEDAKGPARIVDLLLQPGIEKVIHTFHFVGDGSRMEYYKNRLKKSLVKVIFHGFCTREATFNVFAKSHLLLLPSNSEGFPKVVAEAAAFGCVPVVSRVGSIAQFIDHSNGFLYPVHSQSFHSFFMNLDLNADALRIKSSLIEGLANQFTFEYFWDNLNKRVFAKL